MVAQAVNERPDRQGDSVGLLRSAKVQRIGRRSTKASGALSWGTVIATSVRYNTELKARSIEQRGVEQRGFE